MGAHHARRPLWARLAHTWGRQLKDALPPSNEPHNPRSRRRGDRISRDFAVVSLRAIKHQLEVNELELRLDDRGNAPHGSSRRNSLLMVAAGLGTICPWRQTIYRKSRLRV